MYSQHLVRVHHDEWLRYAETRRLVKQVQAQARQSARPRRRVPSPRVLLGALGLRRPVSHA
jgi:hypothetical protein